jgi:hypothetical protein
METFTSTGTATGLWVHPLSGGGTSIGTTYPSSTTLSLTTQYHFQHSIIFKPNQFYTSNIKTNYAKQSSSLQSNKRQRRENH